MSKPIYTAIKRDINSWTDDGYVITWDCGHKHRTVRAACKCLRNMGDAACSYGAIIEGSDGNLWDRVGIRLTD